VDDRSLWININLAHLREGGGGGAADDGGGGGPLGGGGGAGIRFYCFLGCILFEDVEGNEILWGGTAKRFTSHW
jgi:hypothetical protein